MAKKRKTRQEKIYSDLRRQLAQSQPQPESDVATLYVIPTVKTNVVPMNHKPRTQKISSAYSYVLSDLKKTMLLTAIAIAAQLALYFVLLR